MVVHAGKPHSERAGTGIPREASHALTFLIVVSLLVLAVMIFAPAWAYMSSRSGAVLDTLADPSP